MINSNRIPFIDHLRGFMFAYMAFDHALHAYALNWGRFWFFSDLQRSPVWDAFYVFNQSIIMPMLFFIFGMFVLSSFERRGWGGYLRTRTLKLGVPFVFGITVFVPLLMYPRFVAYEDPRFSFWEFWTEIFWSEKLQAGPLWVLYAIALFSLSLILLHKLFQEFRPFLARQMLKISKRPILGLFLFWLFSAVLLGYADLRWGAPWWIGFWKIFYLQGSRFPLYILYFLAGAGLAASGLLHNETFWRRLSSKWPLWAGGVLLLGGAYIFVCIGLYDQGAFSQSVRLALREDLPWDRIWPVFVSDAPLVLLRTSLHAALCLFQALLLLSLFYRFFNQPTPLWRSLAANGFAIFLTHEVLVVWLQYLLFETGWSSFAKFPIVFGIGFSLSWVLCEFGLKRISVLRKILY